MLKNENSLDNPIICYQISEDEFATPPQGDTPAHSPEEIKENSQPPSRPAPASTDNESPVNFFKPVFGDPQDNTHLK